MTAQQTLEQHGNRIAIRNVQSPAYTKLGKLHEGKVSDGQNIDLIVGESIRLFGSWTTVHGPAGYDLTFRIGDRAEYHSYNYHYTGLITAIGKKTVTIEYDAGSRTERKRLSLWEFSWRNKDYDAEKIAANNLVTSNHV